MPATFWTIPTCWKNGPEKEGWSPEYGAKLFSQRGSGWQIEYEPVDQYGKGPNKYRQVRPNAKGATQTVAARVADEQVQRQEGQIRYEAQRSARAYLNTLPGGKRLSTGLGNSDANVFGLYGDKGIRLGNRFYNEQDLIGTAGMASANREELLRQAREAVVAHEWGHAYAPEELLNATREYVDQMSQDKVEGLQKIFNGNRYFDQSVWHEELAAEIMARSVGSTRNTMFHMFGMTEDRINEMVGLAKPTGEPRKTGRVFANDGPPEIPEGYWDAIAGEGTVPAEEDLSRGPEYMDPSFARSKRRRQTSPSTRRAYRQLAENIRQRQAVQSANGASATAANTRAASGRVLNAQRTPTFWNQKAAGEINNKYAYSQWVGDMGLNRSELDMSDPAANEEYVRQYQVGLDAWYGQPEETRAGYRPEEIQQYLMSQTFGYERTDPTRPQLWSGDERLSRRVGRYLYNELHADNPVDPKTGVLASTARRQASLGPTAARAQHAQMAIAQPNRQFLTPNGWNAQELGKFAAGANHILAAAKGASDLLGEPQHLPGPNGETDVPMNQRRYMFVKPAVTGEDGSELLPQQMTLSPENVDTAVNQLQGGWTKAVNGGNLPSNPKDMVATIQARLRKSIDQWVNSYLEEVEKNTGGDREAVEQARATATKIKQLHNKMMQEPLQRLENAINGETNGGAMGWGDTGANASRIYGADNIRQVAAGNPDIAAQIAAAGGAGAVNNGPPTVMSGGGQSYQFGTEGGSSTWNPQRGGMWSGKIGNLLYAAYIGKRMWSMTAGPFFQQSDAYAKYMGEYAGTAMAEGGAGADLASSMSGAAMRRSQGERYMARGAYEQFGGFNDALYSLSGGSTALPRTAAGLGLGAGLAVGGQIAGGAIAGLAAVPGAVGTAFGGLAGIGAALGPVGLVAGGIVAAGTLGFEAYNAANPDAAPLSWGNLASNATADAHYSSALNKALAAHGASGYHTFGMGQENKDYLAQKYGITDAELRTYMTAQQEDIVYRQAKETDYEQAVRRTGERLETVTGEDPQSIQPALRSIQRLTGGLGKHEDAIVRMAENMKQQGYSFGESAQLATNIADAFGVESGSPAAASLLNKLGSAPADVVRRATRAAEVNARYGGMFAPYYSDPLQANQLASQYQHYHTTSSWSNPGLHASRRPIWREPRGCDRNP